MLDDALENLGINGNLLFNEPLVILEPGLNEVVGSIERSFDDGLEIPD